MTDPKIIGYAVAWRPKDQPKGPWLLEAYCDSELQTALGALKIKEARFANLEHKVVEVREIGGE